MIESQKIRRTKSTEKTRKADRGPCSLSHFKHGAQTESCTESSANSWGSRQGVGKIAETTGLARVQSDST